VCAKTLDLPERWGLPDPPDGLDPQSALNDDLYWTDQEVHVHMACLLGMDSSDTEGQDFTFL